jgi:hypothetical protein
MKKIKLLLCTILLLNAAPIFAGEETKNSKEATASQNETRLTKAQAGKLVTRLHEIKLLAKTDLSATRKNELRTEVQQIREDLKNQEGVYLYLSGAAILIIILLLILL